jgi:hypothetical protein
MFTRNLIYHCCPLVNNDLWRRNVEQLLARIDLFNGYKIVAVSTGDSGLLHPIDEVRQELGQHSSGVRFIQVPNDRNLREVVSFRPLLDAVYTLDPNQVVFYAHTKGNATFDSVEGATYWRNVMYHKLLDGWLDRMAELAKYPAVGTHKMWWGKDQRSPYPSRLAYGNWMFAGTFFWFRACKVFEKESHTTRNGNSWKTIPQDRYGAEAWLSGLFDKDEVHSCFQPWEKDAKFPNPYDPELYKRLGYAIEDAELRQPSYCI